MNNKIIKLAQYCGRSRNEGMSLEEHKEKIKLFDELIEDGLMYKDDKGMRLFTNKEDGDYFTETINNWPDSKL